MAASSIIHLFKKSAIEAGTPELYYLNPSDNLWMVASMWSVVEHEDLLVCTMDCHALGDFVMTSFDGKLIKIEVTKENNVTGAARFQHKYGMKKFIIEMNPNFKLKVDLDPTITLSESIQSIFITKLTPEEIRNYAERKNDPKPKAEEEEDKRPYTLEIDVYRLN